MEQHHLRKTNPNDQIIINVPANVNSQIKIDILHK